MTAQSLEGRSHTGDAAGGVVKKWREGRDEERRGRRESRMERCVCGIEQYNT